jgi:hypothetical protein
MSTFISLKAAACKSDACVASLVNGDGGAHMHKHSARAILASLRDAREMDSDEHTEAYDALICEMERAMGLPHAQTLAKVEASVEVRL